MRLPTSERADSAVLCVDIGGSSTKAGLLRADGKIDHESSIPTAPDAAAFFEELVGLIQQTKFDAEQESGPLPQRLGLAVAGFLDEERDYLVYNSNLPWLEGFRLREQLQQRFPNLSIELEVDSNAATMAEYRFGSGRGSRRFLCLTCGTGLGVGMTIDGAPLRFAYGCMGDIGHTVVLRDGPLCACGGRGCAEALLSSNTLADEYKASTGALGNLSLRDVITASSLGEPLAISLLSRAGEWLGLAIASMANTFFPDHIAIAGGLSAAGDIVLKSAERVFRESASCLARDNATFSCALLGSKATLIGAAWPFWKQKDLMHGKSITG